eukprot:g7450.t1
MVRSRSSSSTSSDGGPPEITLDALSADTLAALNAHLAVKEAAEVEEADVEGAKGTLVTEDFGLSQFCTSSDGGPPEITLDALSADTLAALNAHLAVKEAAEVEEADVEGAKGTLVTEDFGLSQFWSK